MRTQWFIGLSLVVLAACSSGSSSTDNGGVQGDTVVTDTAPAGDVKAGDTTTTGDPAPVDTGTEAVAGDTATPLTGCAGLQACCPLLPAGSLQTDCTTALGLCKGIAAPGNPDTCCNNELTARQSAGFCK